MVPADGERRLISAIRWRPGRGQAERERPRLAGALRAGVAARRRRGRRGLAAGRRAADRRSRRRRRVGPSGSAPARCHSGRPRWRLARLAIVRGSRPSRRRSGRRSRYCGGSLRPQPCEQVSRHARVEGLARRGDPVGETGPDVGDNQRRSGVEEHHVPPRARLAAEDRLDDRGVLAAVPPASADVGAALEAAPRSTSNLETSWCADADPVATTS